MQQPIGSRPDAGLVLVVEDANFNSRAARITLESSGYGVIEAEEGSKALTLARIHTPDLVVLDLGLPDVDGLSVATALKADETTRDIPILVCSADDREETKQACLSAGCGEYLKKPFSADEFLAAVERTLGRGETDEPEDAA